MNFNNLVSVADRVAKRVVGETVSVGSNEFQAVIDHGVEFTESHDTLPVHISTIQVNAADDHWLSPRGTRVRLASGREYTTGEVIERDGVNVVRRMS